MKWTSKSAKMGGYIHNATGKNNRRLTVLEFDDKPRCDWYVWESDGNTIVAVGETDDIEQAKREAEKSALDKGE